jgi:hypothetical protein
MIAEERAVEPASLFITTRCSLVMKDAAVTNFFHKGLVCY